MSTNAVVKVVSSANPEGTSKIGKKIKNVASEVTPLGQMLQGKGFVEAQVDAAKAQAHYAKEGAVKVKNIASEVTPLGQMLQGKGFVEAQADAAKAQAHYVKEAAKLVGKAWYEYSPLGRLIDWIKN